MVLVYNTSSSERRSLYICLTHLEEGEMYSIQHYVIVCQWLVTGRLFSTGTTVPSINKTDRHDITEILLKVALSTIHNLNLNFNLEEGYMNFCHWIDSSVFFSFVKGKNMFCLIPVMLCITDSSYNYLKGWLSIYRKQKNRK
jgi:hypothetical protein